MIERTCVYCGGSFQARTTRAMYCGRSCGNKAFTERNAKPCSIDGCTIVARARGLCSTHYNRANYTRDQRHKRVPTPCVVCGTVVSRREDDRYQHVCSTLCRTILEWGADRPGTEGDWAATAALRARNAGALVIEVFDRLEIFERDGWICYLCEQPCEPEGDICNPRAATVDHVIALSNGGDHSRANARTACLGCNSSKAARDRAARAAAA